jgi:hypothetical protein
VTESVSVGRWRISESRPWVQTWHSVLRDYVHMHTCTNSSTTVGHKCIFDTFRILDASTPSQPAPMHFGAPRRHHPPHLHLSASRCPVSLPLPMAATASGRPDRSCEPCWAPFRSRNTPEPPALCRRKCVQARYVRAHPSVE